MTDAELPQPRELTVPTLRAVEALGGTASTVEINAKVVELLGLTDEQLAIEYGDDAIARGPKIYHRLAWARTLLKRIAALSSPQRGSWSITDRGRWFLSLPEHEAWNRIGKEIDEAYRPIRPTRERLVQFREAAAKGDPEEMTVRELLRLWGARRRYRATVERIRRDLEAAGLVTEPDFTTEQLDAAIRIVPYPSTREPSGTKVQGPKEEVASSLTELVVGNIPSATGGLVCTPPDAALLSAVSIMMARDYSQLAVTAGSRTLKGAITWETIAWSTLNSRPQYVRDCLEPHPRVARLDQPLLEVVPDIASRGFVFVQDHTGRLVGIVTAADLATQFALSSKPFLLLGEIENVLRHAIDRTFAIEELVDALDPEDDRSVDGAHSLTLGEIQYLLSEPSSFARLAWTADRAVFVEQLNEVREIRNEVMHFSPDPIEAHKLATLERFLAWITVLERSIIDDAASG